MYTLYSKIKSYGNLGVEIFQSQFNIETLTETYGNLY